MRTTLLFIFLLILCSSCNSTSVKDEELHKLALLMIGDFSNKEQSINDTSFEHLDLKNTRIWKNKPGYWIHSKISDGKNKKKVYYQRIVHYERLDSSTFKSTNYKIINAKDYDTSKKSDYSYTLTMKDLEIRTGCHVYFKKKTSTIYSGKTNKGSCYSDLDYIDYLMNTFVVSKDKITVWTKGYNNKGKQIWGKIKGPYKYKRISNK
ncbi:chromophore lyase CpcT/CpeT [Aquimarina longa]|uniref:chromophore lyase CpcT/CpeT n=1 Tax=Aquimarina longa TaxID=1080221 RepID=UPI0007863413|nr:chromophore lyase CpcT/CpeT [Aquimarina longa]